MKLRHPLTGYIYTSRDDGNVEVADGDRTGVFRVDGSWLKGQLREADPHMLGFVAGPTVGSRGGAPAPSYAAPSGVAIPDFTGESSRQTATGSNPEMDLGLNGRKALVTAATRGIGLAIAQTLADQGCDVAVCARGEAGLETTRKDLEARGAKVFTQALDVSDGDALKEFVTSAAEALGGLDVLVSNASAGGGPGEGAWQPAFDVDVMGAVRSIGAATPFLAESDAGSVVIISSTAALEYLGIPQAYSAMKAALISHASDMSQALAPQGIRVNVVSPGPIYFEGGNWEMIKQAMPAMYEAALAQCAIGRMGTPEEVARAVVFIASPAASLITGSNLVVDGGFTKRSAF
jgi:NAD(P)-dependent dehydrogenase (short-subunit alcohol dehydrogenase family)